MNSSATLTAERLRELLAYDPATGVFTWLVSAGTKKAGATAGRLRNGYRVIGVEGTEHGAHRLAWLYVHGVWPPDQIDHDSRSRADNCFTNLRLATNAENAQNVGLKSRNTSGFTGVCWSGYHRKWQASIRYSQHRKFLGYFDSAELAGEFRNLAATMVHPFAPRGNW